ncbi:hypothetical protein GGI15_002184 [Coemansia interrupta]|uniref:DUF221-domain-containing protein n=1 Tax=Coemansia interrupta TaxID=1126814 RepID=A0A9W8HMY3_9FUNG|nr:hypothetical protein GGI15_002184 [Coemansia interrupta]
MDAAFGDFVAAATPTATYLAQTAATSFATALALQRRDDDDFDESTVSEIDINLSFLFDWGNAPGTGPYFTSNNIDAATQITSAALLGGVAILIFSLLRQKWPELYSHRLRLRYMRPPNIPRTLFGWIYPIVTMSDRHVLETIGLDALLFFRAYRMFIYMFTLMSVFGMAILYPANWYWGREQGDNQKHTVFDSPLSYVQNLNGRYSAAHVVLAYVFAAILFFYIDRFALHTITMRWHYLLLTRRSGTARTLMVTHLPRELRSEPALRRFIAGMQVGQVEAVHVAPISGDLDDALKQRAQALAQLEAAYAQLLGNPCRARTYDPVLLRRLVLTDTAEARALEDRLLRRWARRRKINKTGDARGTPVARPLVTVRRAADAKGTGGVWHALWPFERVDAIDHWRARLTAADRRLHAAREAFYASEAGTVAFVTMRRPVDAHVLSQLSVHARPDTCKIRMAPEARAVVWRNVGKPYSKKMLRYVWGLVMTLVLLLLWCVPVVLISTLISLRFLVTRSPSLAKVVQSNKFVRSLLSYTLPSLILTIFLTVLPRLLWGFVLTGGDRAYSIADKNMFIRHLYFIIIYIIVILGMAGPVWSSVYDIFTDFGGFWSRLVLVLPQMATWYCVYVMLYGAGYQVLKLLHLKSLCRFLFIKATAHTPRQYMKAISPVFIDWGTFQPYTVLFFFIGILYAHLQPLLLPMTVLYYIVGFFVMKYMCVYAWYFRQQTAGALWPVIFRRMTVCVLLYQALTTAIFATNDNHWFVAPMVVLMLFTWYYFWVRCRYLRALASQPPLQLLREADRRREVALAKERAARDSAEIEPSAVTWADRKEDAAGHPAADADADTAGLPAEELCSLRVAKMTGEQPAACERADAHRARTDYNDQALVATPHQPRAVTTQRVGALLRGALLHPIQALINSVSYALLRLQGDPAAPLWSHIDDYAFPERVDALARPAGRSAEDPTVAKAQPASVVDIVAKAARNVPTGLRNVAREFFLGFSIPRAHLDSSVVAYPKAQSNDNAFSSSARRKYHQRDFSVDQPAALEPLPSRSSSSSLDMDFCLAPAADDGSSASTLSLPRRQQPRPIHRSTTYVPRVDPVTGELVAMQYQTDSSELPHGTQMHRHFTDFAQSNMSYLPGVLDSTHFSYLHPGLYGDLPSLWLPVQHLRKRAVLRRTARQRLHDARKALEDNLIGDRVIDRIHEKSQALRLRVTGSTPAPASAMLPIIERAPDTDDAERKLAVSETAAEISPEAVQRKMEDMYVDRRCTDLGIDPQVMHQWDPTGLHDSFGVLPATGQARARAPSGDSSLLDTEDDGQSLDQLSGSESDNSDAESAAHGDRGYAGIRAVEEGGATVRRRR